MKRFSLDLLRRWPDIEADNLFAVDATDRLLLDTAAESLRGSSRGDVVVVGDTAVLRTTVTDEVAGQDGGTETFEMPVTQVWVRDKDAWRCLAGHAGPRTSGRIEA